MDALRGRDLSILAWLAGLTPLVAAHAAYLISASLELAPWCFPHFEGCISVSRAARQLPALHLFRALMLLTVVLMLLFWWLSAEWLRLLAPECRHRRLALLWLGGIGALFLGLYVTFLGVEGDTYRWLRRYGINVHLSFTVLAQILLTSALAGRPDVSATLHRAMVAMCAAMLLLGLSSLPLQFWVSDRDALLNAIEWSYCVLMGSFFPVAGLAWRATGFAMRTGITHPGPSLRASPNAG